MVFEDKVANQPLAWSRLKTYLTERSLSIVSLRLQAFGQQIVLPPHKDCDGLIQNQGYWIGDKIDLLFGGGPIIENTWRGIGYIKNDCIYITWISNNGLIFYEERALFNNNIIDTRAFIQ